MKNVKKFLSVLFIAITIIACKKEVEDVVEPITLSCDSFSEAGPFLLENRGSGIDYTIDCKMLVDGDLTIEPGVVIQFTSNAGMEFRSSGSLIAVGSIDKKIEFIGKDDAKGSWLGLLFNSDDVKNKMQFCKVVNAGGGAFNSNGNLGSIIIWADTKLTISNCEILNSEEFGINASYGGSELEFINNTISGCAMPMTLNAEYVGSISGGSFVNNTTDVIYIKTYAGQGSVRTAQIWSDLGVPYRVKTGGTISVIDVNLTITEGVTIEFESNTGIKMNENSSFSALGTSTKPILFTGVIKQAGSWGSIEFNFTNSPLNEISNATIEYAGESGAKGAISMWSEPDLKMNNVIFTNIEACAFYDAPKHDFDPSSQTINSNLTIQNVTYSNISNQNNSTTEATNGSYCYGG